MSSGLDIHLASEAERLAAFRNVRDIWGAGLSMDVHIARRVRSPQHKRADWFVGCVDGQVVSSLASYPLLFRICGKVLRGIAIGSVHTVEQFRQNGHAAEVVQFAEQHAQAKKSAISLLYSDIAPDYYSKMGYVQCPSWECGGLTKNALELAEELGGNLVLFAAADKLSFISQMYNTYHNQLPITVARDESYWKFLLQKDDYDRFFWVQRPSGKVIGFVRISNEAASVRIKDFAIVDQQESTAQVFYATIVRAVQEWDLQGFKGWLPENDVVKEFFNLQPRSREITMLKSLHSDVKIAGTGVKNTNYFCEIDHV